MVAGCVHGHERAQPPVQGLLRQVGLERLHRQYLDCGLRERDDTGYMRRVRPGYELASPRW